MQSRSDIMNLGITRESIPLRIHDSTIAQKLALAVAGGGGGGL